MQKGILFEQEFSKNFSKNEIPFLISPLLLRENNLGQVDSAKIVYYQNEKRIQLYELKIRSHPSRIQLTRLKRTQEYISQVLELPTYFEIKFCQKTNDSLFY